MFDKIGKVVYRLALPSTLDRVYHVFHVSQPSKKILEPAHMLEPKAITLDETLAYEELPNKILDSKIRETRNQ